jgi:hypothetical protein
MEISPICFPPRSAAERDLPNVCWQSARRVALVDARSACLPRRHSSVIELEPSIIVRRAVVPEDGTSALFAITFRQQFKIYASVTT